ncbi:MAG: hypothetical protein IJ159_05845 [Prevotella sp.]|nr:hypothetical protein [Prevotella sp.]
MNHILFGYHLLVGRFDIFKPDVPSLIAQNLLNLILMIYTAAFTILLMTLLGLRNVLENRWLFLIIIFVFTTIEDYCFFEKNKNANKCFREIMISKNKSDVKWEISAVVFSIGAIVCLYIALKILWATN